MFCARKCFLEDFKTMKFNSLACKFSIASWPSDYSPVQAKQYYFSSPSKSPAAIPCTIHYDLEEAILFFIL